MKTLENPCDASSADVSPSTCPAGVGTPDICPAGVGSVASPGRRRALLGLGAAGGAIASGLAHAQQTQATGRVTEAPESDKTQERRSFYGAHQSGVVTPRPAAGMVASFDVLANDRKDLERMFRTLTERIAFLMQGGAPPVLDPKFPPPDSGILGPVVIPDGLTITASIGASLFDNRFDLAALKPSALIRMKAFPNDALETALCHGDLSLQFCANTPDTNVHALRDILKTMSDQLVLLWKQEGTVPVRPVHHGGPAESARNFLGFRDGSANPESDNEAVMNALVWVQPLAAGSTPSRAASAVPNPAALDSAQSNHAGLDPAEPAWAAHGSYQAVRIIRNFVERWDRTPLQEQQSIFGRVKVSGAPMDGKVEADVPNYAADTEGKVTRLDAHIRLANPRTHDVMAHRILRRPFNYSNGVAKSGQLEMGLLFIAYQANLEKGFIAVQTRLDGEPLEEYIKPIGGGYFFTLPGVVDKNDYLGRSLIEQGSAHV
jgi:deferrochelatase/peroxidase EfeB